MAVDMLNLNEVDQKFLHDNMLTSEDLELDLDHLDFDLKNEGNLFKECNNAFLLPDNFDIESQIYNDICPSPPLTGSSKIDIKEEPLSPPVIQLHDQALWSSEDFYSSINISEQNKRMEVEILETPPNTPPEVQEACTSPVPTSCSNTKSVITLVKSTLPNSSTVTVTPTLRIQPKQTSPVKLETFSSSVQPLILRSDQLTNLGILGVSTTVSSSSKSIASSESLESITTSKLKASIDIKATVQNSPISITNGNSAPSLQNHYNDLKALKRQQRMIKNRESACLSRKKKKEYLQKLETEVKQLTIENNRLRAENMILKQRITNLEKENNSQKAFLPKDMKKTTCFMAIIFMLTMNLAPFGGLFLGTNTHSSSSFTNPHRNGRSLLWNMDENVENVNKFVSNFVDDSLENNNLTDNLTGFEVKNISVCPTYINKTESLRLENELRIWALRVEKQKRKELTKKPKKIMPPVQAWINEARKRQIKNEWYPGHNELQIYRSPQKSFDDFLEAIHRREDTFYFVSFSGDHLLLPAIAHNKTVRPKMSLVMPAMTFNDTVKHPKDHVTMMQIDCEVMNTKIVYVKESVIPPHLRHHQNHTNNADDIYPIYKSPERQRKAKSIKTTKQKHV